MHSHVVFSIGAVIVALISGICAPTSAAERYSLYPLAAVLDQSNAFALGINNANQVAGYIVDAQGDSQAVTWVSTNVRFLPELSAERTFSESYRINDAGQIVGKSRTDAGAMHAVYWDSSGIVDLGTLTGEGDSFALDINEQGTIVGSSDGEVGRSAFSWTPGGGFVDYGNTVPPFRLAGAGLHGINNRGLMVGTTYILGSPFHAAFARAGDTGLTELSPPGRNSYGMALAVNDAGVIVGFQNGDVGDPQAAIFQQDGSFELLGALGLDESSAQDVNQSGTIVGRAFSFGPGGVLIPKAFVYDDGEMLDLLELAVNPEGWTLVEAAAINDSGVIVGNGVLDGNALAFIAVPVPEPAAMTLCAVGILLAVFVFRSGSGRRKSGC
jgi:probable HAF family extracellular repeat protein